MIAPFVLHQPDSLEGASCLLARHGEDAKVLAGGSELILLLKSGSTTARHLIDIKKIKTLQGLDFNDRTETLKIGALVTHRAVESSPIVREHFPLLVEMERRLGNVRIRNVGTLGGNLCLADPNSDPATLLLAYNATVRVGSSRGERHLEISDFLVDSHRTALEGDELLIDINVPKPQRDFSGAYLRFCPCECPTVSVALLIEWKDDASGEVRLVVGCVSPKPARLTEVEEGLCNKSVDEILAKAAQAGRRAALLCNASDDIWSSAEFKSHLVKTLVVKAISQVCRKPQNG